MLQALNRSATRVQFLLPFLYCFGFDYLEEADKYKQKDNINVEGGHCF